MAQGIIDTQDGRRRIRRKRELRERDRETQRMEAAEKARRQSVSV